LIVCIGNDLLYKGFYVLFLHCLLHLDQFEGRSQDRPDRPRGLA
jgi:hypothetical protein